MSPIHTSIVYTTIIKWSNISRLIFSKTLIFVSNAGEGEVNVNWLVFYSTNSELRSENDGFSYNTIAIYEDNLAC